MLHVADCITGQGSLEASMSEAHCARSRVGLFTFSNEALLVASEHQTVLLHEAVEALEIRPDGCYVDATFGRGGHSRAILEALGPAGQLIGIDRDPQAESSARQLQAADARFSFRRGTFGEVLASMVDEGQKLDGLLLDLGVSSPQIDDAVRGFSFMQDGPLDMRMDPERGESAAQWLATATETAIADVLYRYGEERKSRRIARVIVNARKEEPIETTGQLAELVASCLPRNEKGHHPATRTFQAIRIHVNDELGDVERALSVSVDLLATDGRLVIISFHSLEDRMVKRFIRDESEQAGGRRLPVEQKRLRLKRIGKATKASKDEVAANPRSRSAVMRVAARL